MKFNSSICVLIALILSGVTPAFAGYRGGINLYEYVESRPIVNIDPMGLAGYSLSPSRPDNTKHKTDPPNETHSPVNNATSEENLLHGALTAGAHAKGRKLPVASDMLLHWLGNSGADYAIHYAKLLSDDANSRDVMVSELAEAIVFTNGNLSTAPTGSRTKIYSTVYSSAQVNIKNENWYYSIKKYDAFGAGAVSCVMENGTPYNSMTFILTMEDRYNFDVTINNFMGQNLGKLSDLHVAGIAQNYYVSGRVVITAKWKQSLNGKNQSGWEGSIRESINGTGVGGDLIDINITNIGSGYNEINNGDLVPVWPDEVPDIKF